MNYIKIQWSNSCNLDSIYYLGGYANMLYLDTELSSPEYENEVEEKTDKFGMQYPTYQKTTKQYKFEVLAPEYLVDALQLLPLHDSVTLKYTNGSFATSMRNIKVDVDWQEDFNNCLALVTVTFSIDTVQKGACC